MRHRLFSQTGLIQETQDHPESKRDDESRGKKPDVDTS